MSEERFITSASGVRQGDMQLMHHLRDVEVSVNPDKCSLLYSHQQAHPLTTVQLLAATGAGLQWAADRF